MKKVLEINVDDLNSGGVFSLVKNVIVNNNNTETKIDIAAIERFENQSNIIFLNRYNCMVHYIGHDGNKFGKQIHVYHNLKKLLSEQKYDYVHIHADTANKLFVSGLAAKHAKVPHIILHSHSSGVEGNSKLKILIHKICSYRLKHIGTKLVACSEVAANWMFPNAIKDVEIVKNGIPLEKFQFNNQIRKEVRKQLGIEDNEVLVGHVGRLMAPKNHEFLILLVKKMIEAHIPAKLLIVGEGYKEQDLRKYVDSLKISDRVIFFGTSNKVNELLMAMDVFCLPSLFEGFPIVGVEAQASGLPVIFSINITREAKLVDSVKYLPIEEGDAEKWIEAINELAKRHERNNGVTIVRALGYDISDTVNEFMNLYE
ncbi:glycosyltransferase [Clostridiales bacterium]|nr:glycosyltransferase [Clostridiales bacterium]